MSESDASPQSPARAHLLWLLPLVALTLEYFGLAVAFDAAHWLRHEGLEDAIREPLRRAGPVFLLCAAATILLGGQRLRRDFEGLVAQTSGVGEGRLRYALLHLLGLGGLCGLAYVIFLPPHPSGGGALWLVGFLALGIVTVLLLLRAAAPLSLFGRWLSRNAGVGAAGVAMGLLGFAAGTLSGGLWEAVGDATLYTTAHGVALFTQPVQLDPATRILATQRFAVEINEACSGYQGLGMIAVFLSGYVVVSRQGLRFPRALLLVPIGLVTIWSANILRLTSLIALGHFYSPEIAVNGFHANSGWVLFCVVALSLVVWADRSAWLRKDRPQALPLTAGERALRAFLVPELLVLATTMLTGLLSAGVDYLYGLRILAGALALWHYRDVYGKLRLSLHWEPIAIGFVTFGIWVALLAPWQAEPSEQQPLIGALAQPYQALWLALRVVGSSLLIPIVEELAFRGFLLRRLQAQAFEQVPYDRFEWKAFALSSLAFGLLHSNKVAGILAGLLFALAQLRRGRIGDAILAHALTNLLICVVVFAFGWWSLW